MTALPRQVRGILWMVAAIFSFAVQDGLSRLLAGHYNTFMVVMIRYWVFALFVLALALRRPEGWAAVRSARLPVHMLRAVLLVAEICVMVFGFTRIGLINSHAIFATCPLIVLALSGPVLGERLSPRRWLAVGFGALGVLVILQPGAGLLRWEAVFPLASAVMFALYTVLTRQAARDEPFFAAFFWPPIIGAVLVTAIGLPNWQPVAAADWPWLMLYAAVSVASNWLLQKTYQTVEASSVQPFAYLHIVFASGIGLVFFGEALRPAVAIGAAVVVLAGLYALSLARREAAR